MPDKFIKIDDTYMAAKFNRLIVFTNQGKGNMQLNSPADEKYKKCKVCNNVGNLVDDARDCKRVVLGWKLGKSMGHSSSSAHVYHMERDSYQHMLQRVELSIVYISRAVWLCVLFGELLTRSSL
ncbi:hypothetical protein HAX54_023528 [Datura stramonium]|uniref:Uncharacterized protein n=1 Tax=Datura stramonium TaxID=4076 RepID=A0ABS8UY69_DATST|nr:hypothetical protein [Datura stramonium]